tara:strand:+ start:4268 stop:4468 length:201 start_codon:yes stop_codon:yes gene_type:complete
MHLSVIAYNLKKYLKFIEKRSKSGTGALCLLKMAEKAMDKLVFAFLGRPKTSCKAWPKNIKSLKRA